LSEGAGALLIARDGSVTIEATRSGHSYLHRREAKELLRTILVDLRPTDAGLIVASANGTFVDGAETGAISAVTADPLVYTPKPALGESVGAGAIWQIIVAAQALQSRQVPALLHARKPSGVRLSDRTTEVQADQAIVLSCGLSRQAGGVRLRHR
jgi:3-oxoacyl-(acyl-carrier-protein) synthase